MDHEKNKPKVNGETETVEALQNMHTSLLEALRHREQEIFSYLALLVPALGGFVWLLLHNIEKKTMDKSFIVDKTTFTAGTLGVLLMLLLGAAYSLSLGYNFRYITLQLAKIEARLNMHATILRGWPRQPKEFRKYIRWCEPPEIIKFFWYAFLVGILGVTLVACIANPDARLIVGPVGTMGLLLAFVSPLCFAKKFRRLYFLELQKRHEQWGRARPKR